MSQTRKQNLLRNEHGAAQIMTALLLTSVMLSMGLAAIDYTNNLTKLQGQSRRKTEARAALDAALRMAAGWFSNQASCDPAVLNDLLNGLCPDGSLSTAGGTCSKRQITIPLGRQQYTVSFGEVAPLRWDTSDTTFTRRDGRSSTDPIQSPSTLGMSASGLARGSSEDVVIEVWTQIASVPQNASPEARKLNQRFTRRAVLMNTCAYSCTYLGNDSFSGSALTLAVPPATQPPLPCQIRNNRAVGIARTSTVYPNLSHPLWGTIEPLCEGGRPLGDVNVPVSGPNSGPPPGVGDGYVDLADLWILRSYLRSGEGSAWNIALIQGVATGTTRGCGDLNIDGAISEMDLGLLEKKLRGYLYWVPPVWGSLTRP